MIKIESQKGSIMIEAVFSCLLFVFIFVCAIQILNMVKDELYVKKIAREGAREASLSGNTGIGEVKARDVAHQYFNDSDTDINIYNSKDERGREINVVCTVHRSKNMFKFLTGEGRGVVDFDAKAVYPWWDENT